MLSLSASSFFSFLLSFEHTSMTDSVFIFAAASAAAVSAVVCVGVRVLAGNFRPKTESKRIPTELN